MRLSRRQLDGGADDRRRDAGDDETDQRPPPSLEGPDATHELDVAEADGRIDVGIALSRLFDLFPEQEIPAEIDISAPV